MKLSKQNRITKQFYSFIYFISIINGKKNPTIYNKTPREQCVEILMDTNEVDQ